MMRQLFKKCNEDHKVLEAVVLTMRKVNTAATAITKAGVVYDVDNNVIALPELDERTSQKLESAVKGILYLHSVSPLWDGRKTLNSVKDKCKFIAEFNIQLNEAIAKAM